MTIKYIDLFAGVGGFRVGINKAHPDWECVYSNEYDKYANSVYKKHYERCDDRDIRTVKTEEIPDHDLLVGGFPCQAFSMAGKRRGFEDTRGTLFFEIARIAKQKQPRLLLLENVKGLLSHDSGNTFKTILRSLDELGYDCQWQVLNSKDFGVPQNRERVFIIGHLRGTSRPEVFPIGNPNENSFKQDKKLREQISNTLRTNYSNGKSNETYILEKKLKEITKRQQQGMRVYDTSGISTTLAGQAGGWGAKTGLYQLNNFKIRRLTPDRAEKRQNGRRFKTNGEPSFTLTSQDKHGVMVNRKEGVKKDVDIAGTLSSSDWRGLNRNQDQTAVIENMAIRRLTPIECERLQGFPDNWTQYGVDGETISDTQRYKMMGNAVTTNVVTSIVRKLI